MNHLLGFQADVFIECLLIATQTKPVRSDGRTGWRTTPPPYTTDYVTAQRGSQESAERTRKATQRLKDVRQQCCLCQCSLSGRRRSDTAPRLVRRSVHG